MSTSKKLLEIIKKAVREEVRTVVREELKEALGTKKELTPEHIKHGMSLAEMANSPKNPYEQGTTAKKKKRKTVEFTKDPVLNKILNETANEEWKTMGGGTFTNGKAGMASAMGLQSPEQMFGGKPTVEQMLPNDRKHVQVSDDMAEILTKDYSELMKKVDENAKKKRP
jgi:hypothetical protein|tara:strand:- start:739 stop:1245 length:507 start_codon:yes stop_codon:yes gene_type:complete